MDAQRRVFQSLEQIILVLCLMAGFWQTGTVVERYFSYPVKVRTVLSIPKVINLPAVSLCVGYRSIRARIKSMYPDVYELKTVTNKEDPETNWVQYLTVKQYYDVSIAREELIGGCRLFAPNMSQLECLSWNESPVHINYDWKCFTLFSHDESRNISTPYRIEDLFNLPWIEMYIKINEYRKFFISSKLAISVHPREEHVAPDMGSRTFYEFDFSLHSSIALTYTMATNKLLPAPYASNCRNYFTGGGKLVPRKKVIDKCAVKSFRKATGTWARDILAENGSKGWEETMFAERKSKRYSFEERFDCNNKYFQPDCRMKSYFVDVKALMASEKANRCEITIYGPSDSEMIVAQEASFGIIDLFSYGGGVFGLWIGFSILNIGTAGARFVAQVVDKVHKRHKRRRARRTRALNRIPRNRLLPIVLQTAH